jgi:hypothetical protein
MEGSSGSVGVENVAVGVGQPVKVVHQREGVTVTLTFLTPVSGIYVIMRRSFYLDANHNYYQDPKRYFIDIHNVDTNEPAVGVTVHSEQPCSDHKYSQHVLIDQTPSKLVFPTWYRSGYSFDVWSLSSRMFLHSFRFCDCVTAFLSTDGSKLFFDHKQPYWPQKAISIADTDAGVLLWTTEVTFGRLYFTHDDLLMSCFSSNNDHLVIAFTEYIRDEHSNVSDRLTLRFQSPWSGAVEHAIVVCPFSADHMQLGFGEHAVMVAGAHRTKQPAVLLVGIDLVSTRIVLLPESIPENPDYYKRNIRFGPPNIVVVNMDHEKVAKILSLDWSAVPDGGDVLIREECGVKLSRCFRAADVLVTHLQSNRFAGALGLYGTEVYLFNVGGTLSVFRAPSQILKVGAVQADMCILL